MDRARQSRRVAAPREDLTSNAGDEETERERSYFAAAAAAYFLRNLSTRPAVSTIFCLPV